MGDIPEISSHTDYDHSAYSLLFEPCRELRFGGRDTLDPLLGWFRGTLNFSQVALECRVILDGSIPSLLFVSRYVIIGPQLMVSVDGILVYLKQWAGGRDRDRPS